MWSFWLMTFWEIVGVSLFLCIWPEAKEVNSMWTVGVCVHAEQVICSAITSVFPYTDFVVLWTHGHHELLMKISARLMLLHETYLAPSVRALPHHGPTARVRLPRVLHVIPPTVTWLWSWWGPGQIPRPPARRPFPESRGTTRTSLVPSSVLTQQAIMVSDVVHKYSLYVRSHPPPTCIWLKFLNISDASAKANGTKIINLLSHWTRACHLDPVSRSIQTRNKHFVNTGTRRKHIRHN